MLDHRWGISDAADRVWAQIAGMAPSTKPWERLFVVLQAFIDDSYTKDGAFVLGGYIASADAWAGFSKEWEALLPVYGTRAKNGKYHFKMSEMVHRGSIDNIRPFYNVILDHALMAISFKMDLSGFERAKRRVHIENDPHDWRFQWPYLSTPFGFGFRGLLDIFHSNRLINERRDEIAIKLPLSQKVDFYFDDQTEKGPILEAWESYIETRDLDVKDLYGATPRFENDQLFLPLQAADLWAWVVRKAYETGTMQNVINNDFGLWKSNRNIPKMEIYIDDDEQLTKNVIALLREVIGHSQPIYDLKYHPEIEQGLQQRLPFFQKLREWLRG